MACAELPGADLAETVAIFILGEHGCRPDCPCYRMMEWPGVEEAMRRIGFPQESVAP